MQHKRLNTAWPWAKSAKYLFGNSVNKYAWSRLEDLMAFLSSVATATFPTAIVVWLRYNAARVSADRKTKEQWLCHQDACHLI